MVCVGGLLLGLLVISPVLAQQIPSRTETGGSTQSITIPADPDIMKHFTKTINRSPKGGGVNAKYIEPCGGAYVCAINDNFIHCFNNARPYEDIPTNQCYCWADSC